MEAAHRESHLRGSLVVFSDDWGRHPSSCQHVIRELAAEYRVLWVNTIGTRSPRVDLATLRRGLGKIRRPKTPVAEQTPASIRVLNPWMWPWFRRSVDRKLNRRLLAWALRDPIAGLPHPITVVTTIPLVADLVGALAVDRWVYYCVDDLASWPGLDSAPLRTMETELVRKVDGAVAASEFLRDRLQRLGCSSTVVSHGVDLSHWAEGREAKPLPEALLRVSRPWIVFWGLIDERLEADWLLALAEALPEGTIVLAGPTAAMDSRVGQHPRIVQVGPICYDDLPTVARHTAVLVMPYRRMPATEAMQPLKLKEYMATGLPCVVACLPATEPWEDCVDVVSTVNQFTERVLQRLLHGLPERQRAARERVTSESWQAKARQFESVLQDTLSQVPSP